MNVPARRFGWSDMFVAPDDDPRLDGGFDNNERAMLVGYLGDRRLTFEMKCADLDPEGMARRSVPPSDMSLLGLLRHLTDVERHWFRQEMAGLDEADYYGNNDFEGAVPDAAAVAAAWERWREEVAFAENFVNDSPDLGVLGKKSGVPLREVLIHMIEEYARHNGHADLLRERIDGRVGQ
jgi:uncharacterized damage-inducible protein DinB